MAEIGSPTNESLKNWWKNFTVVQRMKKPDTSKEEPQRVFGVPLRLSLSYASVQISTANQNGDLYIWGHIPVVVAKCGLYLKEHATEVEGTFRINGSNKRMRDLQAIFEAPPRYGKTLDWKQEQYTTHDVASVFRRFLTQMPEPVIPHELYHGFRDALAKKPFVQEDVIATYKGLIRSMPRANQYLLLYVLDLLSVFARKSEKNLMTATNLAVIFRPGLISHPNHEMAPEQHRLSQQVLEFLIAHQDWFMLDIPPTSASPMSPTSPTSPVMDVYTDPDPAAVVDDDWKLVEKGKVRAPFVRRRTFSERGMREEGLTPYPAATVNAHNTLGSVLESTTPAQQAAHVRCVDAHVPPKERDQINGGTTGLSRSRTMPSWRRSIGGGTAFGDVANRVLKKRPANLRRDSHKT